MHWPSRDKPQHLQIRFSCFTIATKESPNVLLLLRITAPQKNTEISRKFFLWWMECWINQGQRSFLSNFAVDHKQFKTSDHLFLSKNIFFLASNCPTPFKRRQRVPRTLPLCSYSTKIAHCRWCSEKIYDSLFPVVRPKLHQKLRSATWKKSTKETNTILATLRKLASQYIPIPVPSKMLVMEVGS